MNKTARKEKEKLRKAPAELEEKIAKLRRTDAEKRDIPPVDDIFGDISVGIWRDMGDMGDTGDIVRYSEI